MRRAVIEYSGRWYGVATIPWLSNHRAMLIAASRQWNFDVVMGIADDQLCVRSASNTEEIVRRALSAPNFKTVTVFRIPPFEPQSRITLLMHRAVLAKSHASPWKKSNMVKWYKQYWNIAEVERFRRSLPHLKEVQLIVRTRVDAQFDIPADLSALRGWHPTELRFVRKPAGYYSTSGSFSRHTNATYWCERMWVGPPSAMDVVVSMAKNPAPLIYDSTCDLRCCGFCSEEQSEQQLLRRGARLGVLPWRTRLERIPLRSAASDKFVRSAACHTGK